MRKPMIAAFTAAILVASFCGGTRASLIFDAPGKGLGGAKETRAAEQKSTSQEKNIRLACCGHKK